MASLNPSQLRQLLEGPDRRCAGSSTRRHRHEQVRVRLLALAPDPAPQLVELGEPEAIGA